jgi:iron complex outermembrane recepter protein
MTASDQVSKAALYALSLAVPAVVGAQSADTELLEEVMVTATRQEDTVNRVPLSITAVTQEHLDQQGIKTAADLVRTVPGLNVVANPGGAQQTFSIRGIVGAPACTSTMPI